MFETMTSGLVQEIDRGGVLIAVPRPHDSEKLKPLTVVRKRPAVWFWQKTQYRPTEFTLNDLLDGEPLQPVLEKTKFLKYNEKQEGIIDGSVEAGTVGINWKSLGHGSFKFSCPLGMLHKEVVNMQRLLKDSRNRMVDRDHELIQQTCGKKRLAFTIVMERVFTSCDCNIEYKGVKEGSCSGVLQTLGIYPVEVCLKESASLQRDRNIDMDILAGTVLAYSVVNLKIKTDGRFELSALLDGFESDYDEVGTPSLYDEDIVDGLMEYTEIEKGSSLIALKKELSCAKEILCELTNLPAESRSSLLLLFRQILPNRALLSTLEDKLQDVCLMLQVDEAPFPSQESKSDVEIDSLLDLLLSQRTSTRGLSTSHLNYDESLPDQPHQNEAHTQPGYKNGVNSKGMPSVNGSSSKTSDHNGFQLAQSSQNGASEKTKQSKPVLTAMHILVSAAEGLTDDGLILLESLCSSDILSGLKDLVNLLTDHSQPLPIDSLPTPLQNNDVFAEVEKLFSSSKVILKREGTEFWAEAESSSGHLPLVLCMAILGLACLNEA